MGISKADLVAQLEGLEAQEQSLQRTIAEIHGAMRLTRNLLGRVERAEEAAAKNAAALADEHANENLPQ